MRRKTSNQFLKTKTNNLFLNRVTKLNAQLFVLLLVVFSSVNSFSQSNQRGVQILEKNFFLSSLQHTNTRNNTAYDSLLSLFKDVKSSIYLTNGQDKTFGQVPLCMYTDVASLPVANNPHLLVNDIEMVTVKIDRPSELTAPIDLSVVSRYKNVKYIYFKVSFDFELSQLMLQIKDCDPKVVMVYSIDKRS